MKNVMLTTVDNPYNPFDDFDEWFLYDVRNGYNTCGKLARISPSTDDMSEEEESSFDEAAIDEIIKNDFMNHYKKVTPNDYNKQ